ncbi:MAG: NFACT RNA binding domain-containing protein [Conexivisphaera sp.]
MDLTWFELRSVGMEIGTRLRGYYINNIYRAGPLALVLRLRGPEGRESLLVVHMRRAAWITEKVARIQGMDESSRRLRDHLVRLRIGGASAVKNERIIEIQADPDRRIYMEFFGAGNIVVVYSGIIEAALNSFEGRGRSVIPGAPYELPSPRRMIFEIPADQLISAAAESSRSLDRTLGSKFLAPSKYLEEALWRVGLDPNAPANSVARRDLERLAEELARMYAELTSGTSLYLYRNDGVLEVSASRLRRLEDLHHISPELYESPSEALDAALRAEITEAASTSTDEGLEERRQLEEEARAQEARARELSAKATALRELASGLTSGSLSLEEALRRLEGDVEVRGERVILGDVGVPAGNPYALASAIYGYAKKLESAAESLMSKAAEVRNRAGRLGEEYARRRPPEELVAQERRWYERHRWFYTSSALLAVGGRDASGNSALIRRYMDEGDVVFHAEIVGSPFFILKDGRKAAREDDIREVAQATVSFSRAWREGLAAADAYYVYPEQVSPSAPSGEYLPRGSFMIRGTRNYVKGLKLEVAVGLCVEPAEGRTVLCSAPRRSMDEHGLVYVIVEPGHMKASEVTSKIIRMLSDHLPSNLSGLRGVLRTDEVARLLPPGNSKVVEVARGKRLREMDVGMGVRDNVRTPHGTEGQGDNEQPHNNGVPKG